ncbi:hypothetical protein OSB04_002112 [Centaurea solstitialis]|uniref:MULE transposase domain-containing protein n=1 Tax=Centaurea solstitialis TaxID=347529 RepID=A0AA38U4W2_9ASTR|nr:hypothetical protein OSB04_002112 [Centaurea solstitialis]
MSVHRLLVSLNVTYSRFVRVIEWKCGIEPSVCVTRIAYMEVGVNGVYILRWFEHGGDEIVVDESPYIPQFDSVEIPSNYSRGVDDYNTSYVPATEEPQEEDAEGDEEVVEEDEVAEEDEVEDADFDKYVFDTSILDDEETRREAYFVRSFPVNDDFHYMPPPPTEDVVITPNQPIPYNRRGNVKANQVFYSKHGMTLALGLKFLEEGFEFKTLRSSKRKYEAVCVYENCGWRIYATSIRDSEVFQVRKLNDVHTCSRPQMHPAHRKATRRVLAHLLLDKTGDISRTIRGCDIIKVIKSQCILATVKQLLLAHLLLDKTDDISRTIRGCDIVKEIKLRYKIDISYWKAWRAKWIAIFLIEGNPTELFTRLPQYLYNVELRNPGTVTDITTDVTGWFATCFFALECAIQMFRSGLLRKVLIIDGAHLKKDYLRTMFLAVAMDANNQVVPIAIGVAKSKSGESCTYFFQMVRSTRRCIVRQGQPKQVVKSALSRNTFNILSSNNVECMNAHSRFARKGAIVGLMEYFRAFQQEWHVIAVVAKHNLTDCSQLPFPYFTVDNLKAMYALVVYPVGPP